MAEESETDDYAAASVATRLRRLHERAAPGEGEDLAQDSYVRLLHSFESEKAQIGDPVRYLFGIARNLLIDRFRSRRSEERVLDRNTDLDSAADLVEATTPDPERVLLAKEALARAMAEIDRLPPRCGQAFRMHRFEELTYAEISRRMGISVSAVEKHIADAVLRLRRAAREESAHAELRSGREGPSS